MPQWVRTQVFTTGPVALTKRPTMERVRTDQTLTLVVGDAVCGPCNGGWMKQLGELVMPDAASGMAGEPLTLTPLRARYLAAWAIDRALMIELALREHRQRYFAPSSNLRWLYDHRDDPIPPPGAQVFAAYLHGPESLPAWSATGTWNPDVLEDDRVPLGYISAFSIGHLLFVVFGQDFTEPGHLGPDGGRLGRFELPARYGGYLVPIWPNPPELSVWPPRLGVTREDLSHFADWSDAVVRRPIRRQIWTP